MNSIFYLASAKEIKFFHLEDDVEMGESITVTWDKLDVYTINQEDMGRMTVHGLYSQS